MRTEFRTSETYAKAALEIVDTIVAVGEKRPEYFKKMMYYNRGCAQRFSPFGQTEDGIEGKNPLIVALGDSVTAGHFENIIDPEPFFKKVFTVGADENDVLEITDARECYLEKFRGLLIDKYEQTSVSTVNSGIAGDTMYGMYARAYRDVIRYQPDLIIINGSLNWGVECGDSEAYRIVLARVVKLLKNETKADIVLLTPNMEIPGDYANPKSTLAERVQIIRDMAVQEDVCLADVYKVWEAYQNAGY